MKENCFHARFVLYKDVDPTSGIDLEVVYTENGTALTSTRQYITPILGDWYRVLS